MVIAEKDYAVFLMDRQIAHKISVQVGFSKKQIPGWRLAGKKGLLGSFLGIYNWKGRREDGGEEIELGYGLNESLSHPCKEPGGGSVVGMRIQSCPEVRLGGWAFILMQDDL